MKAGRAVLLLALSLSTGYSLQAQYRTVLDSPGAVEQLRLGVQAYHKGRYAESILLFEKALAYAPGEGIALYWLGRSYAKTGMEETALRVWQPLLEAPDAPPPLRARAELMRSSRSIANASPGYRYVEVARYEGIVGKDRYFQRPSALLPAGDGSTLVVAHGSNELVVLDTGGVVRERSRGGMAGFARPYSAVRLPDGTLFVTEYEADRIARISPDGRRTLFGARGRGPGQLLGPQYIAADESGYLYVADYGNARIAKFDSDGLFVLAFGEKRPESGFAGLASPAGIVEKDGVVYVADSLRKTVYRFDQSGNYLGPLAEGRLHFPEGISFWEGGRSLLVADTDRVVSIEIGNETLREVYRFPDRRARIVGAAVDGNGNLLACDFDASSVSVLSEVSLLAAGYDVEIERINSDAWPKVQVEFSVRDRAGTPVVGLRENNFYVTERRRATTQTDEGGKAVVRTVDTIEPVIDPAAGTVVAPARAVLLLERSAGFWGYRDAAKAAARDLFAALDAAGIARPALVTAGTPPALEAQGDQGAVLLALQKPAAGQGRFDLGLRLAAARLLPSSGRDAIIYMGSGAVDESSFAGTTLSELAALLRNNGLRFFAVLLDKPAPALSYLAERSGGGVFAAARPRGLGDLAATISTAPSGRYRMDFVSRAESVFGRAYLSVAVEAYLYKKSGKDELGYYAPLK